MVENAVTSWIEWKDINRMARAEAESANILGGEILENNGSLRVPDIPCIKNTDFNNFLRKFLTQSARLHSDCRQSLTKYAEIILKLIDFQY